MKIVNSISACLDSLIAIDDQVFLAECDVMLANDIWLNKMSDMIKYSGNSDSMISYIQEADYGRRDIGGNQWLSKLRIFILKCIDKIVDTVTNFLLKIKTRKADYIRIPYKYEDLMEDINLVKSIDKEIYQIFDNVENFASADNVKKLAAIKEKLRNTHFAKNQRFMISDKDPEAHNKLNKYGIKPDQYMKLAKELRDLNRALEDTKTRASKMDQKEWLKDPSSTDKARVAVQEFLFNIYAEMSKMIVKLMQSFTVSGVEKMNQAIIEKKIKTAEDGIIKLQKIIGEAVEHDIDDGLEYFDETEKPFDEFLNKHKYDSKTNTIEVDGRRFNAGKIPSKKERNRMNRFLRENNYDPKTETYESDIKDGNGKNERIKLNIVSPSIKYDNAYHLGIAFGKKGFDDSINLSTNTLKEKPHESNQTLKHEEGHAAQSRGKHSTDFEGAKKLVDENDLPENKHYSANESDADLYGYEHNPYANKNRKNKTSFSVDSKDTKKLEKSDEKDIKKIINDVNEQEYRKRNTELTSIHVNNLLRENLHLTKKTIEDIDVAISDAIKLIDEEPIPGDFEIPKESLIEDVERMKKRKKDVERRISTIEEKIQRMQKGDLNFKIDDTDKRTINQQIDEDVKDYISLAEHQIKRIKMFRDSYKKELQLRNKFLDQHADEAGSKARKLEGRQGKHKGKK